MILTNRQQEVLAFLREYHAREKFMPTTREIAAHFGFVQTAAICHLKALEERGAIRRSATKARSIVLLVDNVDMEGKPC